MTGDTAYCGHCDIHHPAQENYFFTKDFARHYSNKPGFILTWCRICSNITIFKPQGFLRLLFPRKVHYYGYMDFFKLRDYVNQYEESYRKTPGTNPALKLYRMIWHSINEHVEVETGQKNEEAALHLAMDIIPAYAIASMILMTLHARRLVPLERQIMEGYYIKEVPTLTQFENWVKGYHDIEKAKDVIERLYQFTKEHAESV